MRFRILKSYIIFLVIVMTILIIDMPVEAAELDGFGTGITSSTRTCVNDKFCFTALGIRISIYEDGTELGVNDYDVASYAGVEVKTLSDYFGEVGDNPINMLEQKGRLYYTANEKKKNQSFINSVEIIGSSEDFPCYYPSSYDNNKCTEYDKPGGLEEKIKAYIKERGVLGYIKNATGKDIDNKEQIYFVVEPTIIVIYNVGQASYHFYGTIYQLVQLFQEKKVSMAGFSFLHRDVFNSIYVPANVGKLMGGKIEGKTAKTSGGPYSEYLSSDNKSYGLAVIKASDIVENDTCSTRCSGSQKNTDARLKCAENFCQSSSNKKDCITSCGYSEPAALNCSNINNNQQATTTYCQNQASGQNQSCSYNSGSYLKTVCTEKTQVLYSNDLPVLTRGGFNYSLQLLGNKTCTYQFDYKKAQFDYAVASDTSTRTNILNAITSYQQLNNTSYIYKIDSQEDSVTMTIGGENRSLRMKDINTVIGNVTGSSGKNTIKLYANGQEQTKSTYQNKNATSSASIYYYLEPQCYSLKTGLITAKNGTSCDFKNEVKNEAYYGYYIDKYESGKVDTKTVVVKKSSGLNDTNKCYYEVGDPSDFTCQIQQDSGGNYISSISRGNKELYYYHSSSAFDYSAINSKLIRINNDKTYLSNYKSSDYVYIVEKQNSQIKEVKACPNDYATNFTCKALYTPSQTSEIRAYCTSQYSNDTAGYNSYTECYQDCTSGSGNKKSCKALYNPSQYDDIRSYCTSQYNTDIAGYASFTDCYQDCTSGSGNKKSCKQLFSCNETTAIKNYCSQTSNLEREGFASQYACYNSCSCNTNKMKEYFYRPISLENPFPNREAGSNWQGWNMSDDAKLISEDDVVKTPQFVIELDGSTIKEIRNKNTDKNVYVEYAGTYQTTSGFKSDFLTWLQNQGKLTCRNQQGEGCEL